MTFSFLLQKWVHLGPSKNYSVGSATMMSKSPATRRRELSYKKQKDMGGPQEAKCPWQFNYSHVSLEEVLLYQKNRLDSLRSKKVLEVSIYFPFIKPSSSSLIRENCKTMHTDVLVGLCDLAFFITPISTWILWDWFPVMFAPQRF